MRIVDGHSDVLLKLWERKIREGKELDQPFYNDADWLQVTKSKLDKGKIGLQACAIYLYEDMVRIRGFETALEMIELFYTEIATNDTIVIKDANDLKRWQEGDQLGLILTLEGADAVEGDLIKLQTLHRLGVRWVGLTHNPANQVADGVGEERGAGLSQFGRQFVQELNRLKMGIDVSHLSEKGFWDVVELSTQPVFASHSNAREILDHPRNLTDKQIKALINLDGLVGITYVPQFTAQDPDAVVIADLLPHIERVLSLGGENHIGLGSDFDGISKVINGLEDSSQTYNLVNELLKYYSEEQVEKITGKNWIHLMERLWL